MKTFRQIAALAVIWAAGAAGILHAADFDRSHAQLTQILRQHVREARVNYAALKKDSAGLNRYLDVLAAVSRDDFKNWTEAEQIAFLVNAYNAWTLRLIVDHHPVASIRRIGGWFSGPWDQKIVRLFGTTITLDDLEHKMLRGDYAEPRVHFALVCAAKGCPPLRDEAYTGARLNEQFDDQARRFLGDPAKNRVDAARRTVFLSPVFKWFAGDFERKSGSVLAGVAAYWPPEARAALRDDFKIRYTDYDWSLNEQIR